LAIGKTLAELNLADEDRSRLEKKVVFTPLPFVKRVIFISTPIGAAIYRKIGSAPWSLR